MDRYSVIETWTGAPTDDRAWSGDDVRRQTAASVARFPGVLAVAMITTDGPVPVDDIAATVDALRAAGVAFEQYDAGPMKTDERGIAHPGPKQAWFKDPAGNILSIIES